MSDGVYAKDSEFIANELREEFIDETREKLQALDEVFEAVYHETSSIDDLVSAIRRAIIPIAGQARNYGIYALATVSVRLEDFLSNLKKANTDVLKKTQDFLDVMMDILDGKIEPDADVGALVRSLPPKVSFDVNEIEVRDVEVLLVMLHGASTHFVEREMQACGYRVSTITNTFEAIPLVVHTQPDLVIISAMMPNLSGIDLAVALSSMPATRNTPCALITSMDKDDEHLGLLPDSVPIISKGPSFGDDIAEALSNLFLL